ncbi:MAG TPA: exodeoxyribonuclease VII small subunit [Cytophagales bacterium]|nr:exodeoxyribonuclease VII small subunit [Cytophagales bacterium]
MITKIDILNIFNRDTMKKGFSYTKAIEELEQIMTKIEEGNASIDELHDLVDRAAKLISQCKTELKGTTQKIEKTLDDLQE